MSLVLLIVCTVMSIALTGLETAVYAQAVGVPIVRDGGEELKARLAVAGEMGRKGKLLDLQQVKKQMSNKTCELTLPKPSGKRLSERALWQRSLDAHVRVGWHYLCPRCNNWHQNLAGGYFITETGEVVTCYHVIEPPTDAREGYLVAATEADGILPVTEILAANAKTDSAIIRVKMDKKSKPLSLNTNVYPGDAAWCFSDPLGRSGYFSQGIVNRFYYHHNHTRNTNFVARMEVSTAWAPGSSGAAVLDQYGNAIGHVSEISADGARPRGTNSVSNNEPSLMIFHSAVRAADVIDLVRTRLRD